MLVAEAHEEAKRALADLRDLARGIHPAILTEQGLDAALSALAARAPVPVEVEVGVGRLPAALEAAAYFIVAEALANVAKHAERHPAPWCACTATAGWLVVEIEDDGAGGADSARQRAQRPGRPRGGGRGPRRGVEPRRWSDR